MSGEEPSKMISTRSPGELPNPYDLRRLLMSLATLDAILEPEWQYRYYSFDSRWGEGQEMGSMRNGCGDHWFALFLPVGVGVVGLAHESPMFRPDDPWPGIFSGLPLALAELKSEPAFDTNNCSFCLWCLATDSSWSHGDVDFALGDDPDGSAELLHLLDGDPRSYAIFAAEYFEVEVSAEAVAAVYAHEPLTVSLLARLNPNISLLDLQADLTEIDYP
jgi:hypothetical protein